MGTGVVGGMLVATFIATIFVPLFFTLFARREKMGEKPRPVGLEDAEEPL
jgi:HAE1 family hydrophobic/amphiphilic exporter-1/multidrug efflux pump